MVKLLKYCLSLYLVVLSLACHEKEPELDASQRRALAEEVFKNGSHLPQGSPKSMTRIEEAIKIDTTYAEAIRELSVAYLKRGMPHKWRPIMDRAVYYDAKTWQPWRGYLYLWFYRDYEKAIADFNASDTLTPHIDYPQGHSVDFWRGIAYLGLKDYENSIAYWDKHIVKETNDSGEDWVELEAFLYRGIAHYESGNTDKAMENFEKILQYFKVSADAKYYMAKIFLERKQHKKAKKFLEEAKVDFKKGFYNNRPYVEALREIYWEDLEGLGTSIGN